MRERTRRIMRVCMLEMMVLEVKRDIVITVCGVLERWEAVFYGVECMSVEFGIGLVRNEGLDPDEFFHYNVGSVLY